MPQRLNASASFTTGGCKTCKNYDVLNRTKKEMCLCTGMLYDPKKKIK